MCLIRLSFIKVTTSVTHASIYRLGSFLEKLSWENFLEKLLWEDFLEKLELSYTPPIIAKLTPMTKKRWKYKKKSPYYKDYSKCPEIQLRICSHEKTTPTYIVSFVGDTEQQNFLYHKKILSASVWKWNSTMSTEKYQAGRFNDQFPLLFFSIQSPDNIWTMSIRKCLDRRHPVILLF